MSLLSPPALAPHTSDKSLSPVRVGFALSDETVRYVMIAYAMQPYSMHIYSPLTLRQTMQYLNSTMQFRTNSVPAMLLCVMRDLDHLVLQTPKEIHVRKLLHLFHVSSLGDLLVVEKNPRCSLLVWQLLANKGNVVAAVD